ncbi:hypothetical protein [Streptomyces sp. NPDC059802]|uniref:hypothetical protein n=1 Tax=Streptomyces sp. NPDC059802 TaxID=3346952 RepID=UPI0036480A32
MLNRLDSIDWSSMSHAYGPAIDVPVWLREMGSADPDIREKAFSGFYSAAHHQGAVYTCTTASLPFLFDMADAPAAPGRVSVIGLLLSIGREAMNRCDGICFGPDDTELASYADSVAVMREHADDFVRYAADPDPLV